MAGVSACVGLLPEILQSLSFGSLKRILSFLFPDEFVVFFNRFGEVSSDELAERAVVEPEPPCHRLDAFGGRGVQAAPRNTRPEKRDSRWPVY